MFALVKGKGVDMAVKIVDVKHYCLCKKHGGDGLYPDEDISCVGCNL